MRTRTSTRTVRTGSATTRAAALLGLSLALAACSAPADDAADADAPTAAAPDATDDTGEDGATEGTGDDDAAADGEATVALGETSLGQVLVDGDGMTLYMFDPDEQGPSTCYDACATAWPPVVADAPVPGDGVDESLLGTVERTDGSVQVTYDGWPLYLFAQDAAPGDVAGQGANDVWWVLDASGAPVRD